MTKRDKYHRLEQPPCWAHKVDSANASTDGAFNVPGKAFRYTGSGKASLRLVLSYLARKGVIENKMSPIHVPSWIGAAVYQTIIESGFPVTSSSVGAKVIIPYHQYGFPQDMDRVLDYAASSKAVVIEDCAHGAYSFSKGRRLGAIGDFGIFSFSKFTFCRALGGVSYTDGDFERHYFEGCERTSRLFSGLVGAFKTFDEWNLSRGSSGFKNTPNLLRKMSYSIYGDLAAPGRCAIALWSAKWRQEIDCRLAVYEFYRDRFARYGLCDHLEADGVTPYVVPLRLKEKDTARLVERLRTAGFECGVRQFDMNRFFAEPDFQPTVIIPINTTLGMRGAEQIADIVDIIAGGKSL